MILTFPVRIRDVRKIEKKNSISISIFGYENMQSMYQKCYENKKFDLLLIEEEDKRHYVLIEECNTFTYDDILKTFLLLFFTRFYNSQKI